MSGNLREKEAASLHGRARGGPRSEAQPVREIETRQETVHYVDYTRYNAEEVVQNVEESDTMSLAVRQAKEHIVRLAREHELFINATRMAQRNPARSENVYSERIWTAPERKRPRSQPEMGGHTAEVTSTQKLKLPRQQFFTAPDSYGTSLMALRCAVELFAHVRGQKNAAIPVGSILTWAHDNGYGVDDVLAAENILTRGGLVQRIRDQAESRWIRQAPEKIGTPRSPTELLKDALFGVSDTPGGRGNQELLAVIRRPSVQTSPQNVSKEKHIAGQQQTRSDTAQHSDHVVGLGAALPPRKQPSFFSVAKESKIRKARDSRLQEMHSV